MNPSGMRGDILTGAGSGENLAPDWVWESAGVLTPTGYNIDMRVPLESVRFRGGDEVRMGVLFWRRVSRPGVSLSWPDLPPGRSIVERYATAVFRDLPDRRTREVAPAATYSVRQTRATPSAFNGAGGDADFGVSAKCGLSSSVTLDATVSPDFSQVESDAFQVEVNQRYPVFFSEKRPFFMEGSELSALAGPGRDANMVAAVHTRRSFASTGSSARNRGTAVSTSWTARASRGRRRSCAVNIEGRFVGGYATYYDPVEPFQGEVRQSVLGVSFEPVPQFTQAVSVTLVDFTRASDGDQVCDVRIVNTRTVYQFNEHFFVRGIVQFASQQKRILTDLLASDELRPGTVLHGGYRSLLERRAFEDGRWIPLEGSCLTAERGLFFKASCLYRF